MNQAQRIKKLGHGGMKSLVKKAIELGVAVSFPSDEYPLIKFAFEKKVIFTKKGEVPIGSRLSNMTTNKNLTKTILKEVGISSPRGIVADSFREAILAAKKNKLSYPLIVKPLNDSLARGVTWNIKNKEEFKNAVAFVNKGNKKELKKLLVEEMFIGDEFRVLVLEKRVISCVKKVPATLIGDGNSSIKKLVKKFNKTRLKGFEIKIDKVAEETLEKNKFTLNSVLDKNFALKLRNNLNMSDGGRCIEFTEKMNRKFKDICEKAVEILGLTYGGIDLMTRDIADKNSDYVILEVNPNPFYNMHEKPLVEGVGVDVSSKILKSLFPELKK